MNLVNGGYKPIASEEERKLTVLSVYGFCRKYSPKNNVYRIVSDDIIAVLLKYYYLQSIWSNISKSTKPLHEMPASTNCSDIMRKHQKILCKTNPKLVDTETLIKALCDGLNIDILKKLLKNLD